MERSLLKLLEESRKLGTWSVDVTRSTVWWSAGTYAIHEEDPSKPIDLEAGINYYVPEDRPVISDLVARSIEKGEAWDVELKIRTAKGSVRWVRATGQPVFEGETLVRLQGIFEDVDGRKRAELAARTKIEDLNRRLTLALEASQIGVWEWNIETDELIWDQQMYANYGIKQEDFSGAYDAWENGLHPEDMEAAKAQLAKAIEERGKFVATFRVVWPDGTTRTIQGFADVVLDEAGKPHRMIGANWDVTEVVRIRQDLERSNHDLAQFAYRTSHDLKSPLTAIRRLTAYMLDDLKDGDLAEVARNVDSVGRRAEALEKMVIGILDTAKARLAQPDPEPIDMEELLAEVAEAHSELCNDKGVAFRSEVALASKPVLPRVRLLQILSNLVSNGIKYSSTQREQPFVVVRATGTAAVLELVVEDNGSGMPVDATGAPYEMFRRFHSDASGSGLGLYIAKQHVESLGGEIDYLSSDGGTSFTIKIPLV